MNNYSSSSYYRANPYKDIGYMPPIAQKNRSNDTSLIPHGQQYFDPTTKKHYNKNYHGEIQNQSIMRSPQQLSQLERQAFQKSYFRSLNSKDIQGSSTNTLISKAVKNKMKAQQQLQKRKSLEQQNMEMEKIYQFQRQQNRKREQDYHASVMNQRISRNNMGNDQQYTQKQHASIDQKKKREMQLLKLAQQRKNYAIVDFPGLYNQSSIKQNNSLVQPTTNFHQKQLQKRRKTQRQASQQDIKNSYIQPSDPIKPQRIIPNNFQANSSTAIITNNNNKIKHYQLQYKDSLGYANQYKPSKINTNYTNLQRIQSNNQNKPGSGYAYNRIQKDQMRQYRDYGLPNYVNNNSNNIKGILKQQSRNDYGQYKDQDKYHQIAEKFHQREKLGYGNLYQDEQNAQNMYNNDGRNGYQQRISHSVDNKYANKQQQQQQYQYNQYQQNQQQKQPQQYIPSPPPYNQNSHTGTNNQYNSQIRNNNEQNNLNTNLNTNTRIQGINFKNKQQLRRHNPTFLSYGSPTFSIASRNVIGY